MLLLPESVPAELVVATQPVFFLAHFVCHGQQRGESRLSVSCMPSSCSCVFVSSSGVQSGESSGIGVLRGGLAVGVFWRFPGFSWEIVPCNTALSVVAHCQVRMSFSRHFGVVADPSWPP
mmetsp:Transcript_2552/g.5942  ORF Transcript_2552/g.5942 Transcript_2552/m.5942 type:complete len:120 (+) Transcript_2552:1168-1527(+)